MQQPVGEPKGECLFVMVCEAAIDYDVRKLGACATLVS